MADARFSSGVAVFPRALPARFRFDNYDVGARTLTTQGAPIRVRYFGGRELWKKVRTGDAASTLSIFDINSSLSVEIIRQRKLPRRCIN